MPHPQLTSIRPLFSHSSNFLSSFRPSLSHFFPKRKILQPSGPFSLSTFLSSSSRRPRSLPPVPNLKTRGKSSKGEKGLTMEETQSIGFNRKRAEGRDKSDKPRILQKKVRKLNPVNTICYVQILGTGMDTQDTSPSVLLFFDKQRFIFNAGEGLQRFCTEHKIKLSKIDHIFLSRVCSETAGGLPGLLLTLAGIGDVGMLVNIWGPSDLQLLVDAMKSFIPNAAMIEAKKFGPSSDSEGIVISDPEKFSLPIELVEDEVVKISAVLLRPSFAIDHHFVTDEHGMVEGSIQFPESQGSNGKMETALKPGDLSVVYVCELPEIQGKFDPEKAKALGLKPGPKYRELQLNKSVKSDHLDIMVHPSDVMEPSVPGPIILIVDCPTVSHLQNLLTVSSLSTYYTNLLDNPSGSSRAVTCIIHLSPSSVTHTPDYQRWKRRFGNAQHIMAGHEPKNAEIPILKSSARIAARLNYLCPQFFPAPGFWPIGCINNVAPFANFPTEVQKCVSAENLLKFHLRPLASLGLDRACIPSSTSHSEIIGELLTEIPEIVDAQQQVRQCWGDSANIQKDNVSKHYNKNNLMIGKPWCSDDELPICLENIKREDMEIVLLGTGSSQPSKYRNVSSVYINLFSKGSLLFDCGEGTLGQLKRRFGMEGADNAVRSLRCIWISHIHADHHTGLARILSLRRDLLKEVPHEPLLVIGPRQLKRFLDAYQKLEDLDMQFLDCWHTTQAALDEFESSLELTMGQSSPGSDTNSQNPGMRSNSDIDATLFAKGSPMQSIFKRPGSPADPAVAYPILKTLKKVLHEAGLDALVSFPVVHCPQAFGIVLQASERINGVGKLIPGWKIVYSGDTRPCPQLIEASCGATVLIHEATFEDGMVDEAVAKNHSTTKEAIEVGNAAGVYRIILTHFSQRYPKIPVFDETHMHKTCIGFDMMSINMADLPILPKVLPYLKLLFRNEMVVDELDDVEAVGAAAQ
ncbi:tRNAse Z trz4, mitochondrial [Ancistrocladus abbreviatus]